MRKCFVQPLAQLTSDYTEFCKRWEKANETGTLPRPDLLLNDVLPEAGIGRLRKLLREAAGKLEDALGGVYRYRNIESKRVVKRKPHKS